jgi:hypothetical protein
MPIAVVAVPTAALQGQMELFFRRIKAAFICRDASLSISLKMRVPRIMAVSGIPPREPFWVEFHPSSLRTQA